MAMLVMGLWPHLAPGTLLFLLAAVARRLEEIGDHRGSKEWTWLPPWFWEKVPYRIVDGYHISGYAYAWLNRVGGIWCGYAVYQYGIPLWSLAVYSIVMWLVEGYYQNLFYHVNLMHEEKRDYRRLWIDIINLWRWINGKELIGETTKTEQRSG